MRNKHAPGRRSSSLKMASLAPLALLAHPALASEQVHTVDPAITWLFTGILLAMVACLAFEEKLHAQKSLITGLFALLSLLIATALELLPFGPVINVSLTNPCICPFTYPG